MIELREIGLFGHLEHMEPMLVDHWLALGKFPDLAPLKPDFATVLALEEAGKVLSIGAFDGDELVGYSVNLVTSWMHSVDALMCQNVVLWLDVRHRAGSNGLRLIRQTERLARARGCGVFLLGARDDTTLFELLPKLKYEVHETVYARVLS